MSIPPKDPTKNCKFISIEGNIGSGKSTILRIIRDKFPQLTALDQPLAQWQAAGENKNVNLLQLYYKKKPRWGFTFQINAFMTRLQSWTEYSQITQQGIKLSERSLVSDKNIFASIMRDTNILNELEYQIYLIIYNGLISAKKITDLKGVIYIKCCPKICDQRIKQRAREGEEQIPLQYLQKIHNKHEEWLLSSDKNNGLNVLIIDNTRPINQEKIVESISEWLNALNTSKEF